MTRLVWFMLGATTTLLASIFVSLPSLDTTQTRDWLVFPVGLFVWSLITVTYWEGIKWPPRR